MKKIIFIITVMLCLISIKTKAQQGYKGFYSAGGYTWQHGGDVYLGLDFPNNSFHGFEVFAHGFFHEEETNILGGLAYKHCLFRGINSSFRFKVAGSIGTTTHKAIFGGTTGFEYLIGLSPRVDLLLMPEGGYFFNSAQRWRFTTLAGLRFNF